MNLWDAQKIINPDPVPESKEPSNSELVRELVDSIKKVIPDQINHADEGLDTSKMFVDEVGNESEVVGEFGESEENNNE